MIDKHKKPLVVDGENASVEVATTDNGARITGDLEVTGNLTSTNYPLTPTESSGGTSYWNQMVSGYRTNNTSTSSYYTFYRFWFENWGNADSSPASSADSDSYACYFIAPRAGTITNVKIQGYATDTGATDPVKFYLYKAPLSNNEDSTTATSMGDTGTITPPANGKTFSHTVDFSSSNTFAEDDRLFIWLKKDSNSGNQDLYFNINVSGEYS